MKKNIVEISTKIVCYVTKKLAERDVNTTCPYYAFQAKLPPAVKKLRK